MSRRIKASTSSSPVDREGLRLLARAERDLLKALGVYTKFSSASPDRVSRRRSDEAVRAIKSAVASLGTVRGVDPSYNVSDPDLIPEGSKAGSGYKRARDRARGSE